MLSPAKHLAAILNAWHEGGNHEWISPEMEAALCEAETDFDGVDEY